MTPRAFPGRDNAVGRAMLATFIVSAVVLGAIVWVETNL